MLQALEQTYDLLFGCKHRRLSRPFTLSGKTYEVCLTCGRKFSYSLDTMSLIKVTRGERCGEYAPSPHSELSLFG
jgi:DNA-directed RNA polymerase subunit RPC12/RpoP